MRLRKTNTYVGNRKNLALQTSNIKMFQNQSTNKLGDEN
jgi:hypothetical protein